LRTKKGLIKFLKKIAVKLGSTKVKGYFYITIKKNTMLDKEIDNLLKESDKLAYEVENNRIGLLIIEKVVQSDDVNVKLALVQLLNQI
jgi:hypothetical protein